MRLSWGVGLELESDACFPIVQSRRLRLVGMRAGREVAERCDRVIRVVDGQAESEATQTQLDPGSRVQCPQSDGLYTERS